MFTLIPSDPQVNVFQMWFDRQADEVWFTRTTWNGLCARITNVGESNGPAPYYGNPKVFADLYYSNGNIKERGIEISAAGTFKTYRQIQPPFGTS
ncbi:hypothetical protein DZC30_19495 [Comamonas testosteroni]|uniref:Uncharacterized protein n=1 Tax=Comamonas testosteroni TaxID=285 RepID=A0A373FBV0_COMTE|nr:hypothetical protein [Comamonas testosteroni]RGE40935.1 hypothetical protein DZC30_19495 [Comamonas testosteroni]